MVCSHVKELYRYVKDNNLKVSAHDIITVECKRCKDKEECETIN